MMNKIKTWCRGVVKGFLDNHCSMHAAGLTYFSMLAMMPILCCILVVAKAVGVDEYARTHINERIDALITHFEKGQDDELAAAAGAFSSEEDVQKKRIAAEDEIESLLMREDEAREVVQILAPLIINFLHEAE